MTGNVTKTESDSGMIEVNSDKSTKNFTDKITSYNALACTPHRGDNYNREQAITESVDTLKALKAQGGLQEMLVAQMASIHLLQQMTIALANSTGFVDSRQYYTNSAVKLSNCFTQQAALLARLQGAGGQKIVVEHVEVHHGGQAVVGNINGGAPIDKEKI